MLNWLVAKLTKEDLLTHKRRAAESLGIKTKSNRELKDEIERRLSKHFQSEVLKPVQSESMKSV